MSHQTSVATATTFLSAVRYFAYMIFVCILILGSMVIWGWYTHDVRFIQVSADYVPMQFNTALSFIIITIGLLGIEFHARRLAQILGVLVLFSAAMVLLEYVFSFSTGLDQLFLQHYITVESAQPGRMAPNTALAFIMAGITILLLSSGRYTTKKIIAAIFLNFILFILGYTAFIGYCSDASTLSRWGNTTSMAWHTAFGFMLWGGASIILGLVEAKERGYKPKVYLTTILFLASAFFFTLLWQLAIFNEATLFRKNIATISGEINRRLSNKLTVEFFALIRLASRNTLDGEVAPWKKDVNLYLEHHDSIYCIGKMNPDKEILQFYIKDNMPVNLSALQPKLHRMPFNESAISLFPIIIDNTSYFVAFFPMEKGGYVIVLYDVNALMHAVLPVYESRYYNFDFRLNNHLLTLSEKDSSPSLKKQWSNTRSFMLYGSNFQFTIWPSWKVLNDYKSYTPSLILLSGIILAFCIALLFFQRQSFYQKSLALENFNRELEHFSYTIAHNLKAPLRHITGYMHLLFRYQKEENEAGQKKCLSAITVSAAKMDKLIDSLLQYAAFSRAKLEKYSFSLNAVIDDAISKLSREQTRAVQWHIHDLPCVFADYTLFITLFKELFTNAVKFSTSGETIAISVKATESKRGTLIIIQDNGIGLKPKYQEKAFLLFHQLDKEAYGKGVGAGLAYVSKIVERHEGTISIEPHAHQGTTIHIFLPKLDQ
ncbi:MAG: HAMP domain-containing sensor histidine kinase [Legionellaceae bacterium]|nr:HAMP domain-containing sensor histidine kinase [Legionellaceae bacterium]